MVNLFHIKNSSINKEIYKELQYLNNQPYQRYEDLMGNNKKGILFNLFIFLGLEVLPDGCVKFYEANDNKLSFTIQINDLRIPEYHRFECENFV